MSLLTIQASGFGQVVSTMACSTHSMPFIYIFLKSYSKYFYSGATLIGGSIQKQAKSTVVGYKNHIL